MGETEKGGCKLTYDRLKWGNEGLRENRNERDIWQIDKWDRLE